MIRSDLSDWRVFENKLDKLRRTSIPYAQAAAVNSAAFATQRAARSELGQEFTLRNRWTQQSIRVNRASPRSARPSAAVGSVEDYMRTQEFGGIRTPPGRTGVVIPTAEAAGQRGIRTRLPTRRNKLRNITLSRGGKRYANKRQANAARIAQARRKGGGVVYLDTRRGKAIYRVTSSRVRMLYDMSRQSVVIPASPWLAPVTRRVAPELPGMYARALRYQLRRLK